MAISQQGLTLEEFLELPEEEPALEYEDGKVIQKVSPKGPHSTLQSELVERFNDFGKARRFARAYPELRVTFGGRAPVPDVVVYLWERIPRNTSGEVAEHFTEPPDIAVEIISPGQGTTALVRRCLWYVEHGVRVALLVDPFDRSVLVFRLGAQVSALGGGDRIDVDDVLPGFQLTVDELFVSLLE